MVLLRCYSTCEEKRRGVARNKRVMKRGTREEEEGSELFDGDRLVERKTRE